MVVVMPGVRLAGMVRKNLYLGILGDGSCCGDVCGPLSHQHHPYHTIITIILTTQ